jgi:hypothetical protein
MKVPCAMTPLLDSPIASPAQNSVPSSSSTLPSTTHLSDSARSNGARLTIPLEQAKKLLNSEALSPEAKKNLEKIITSAETGQNIQYNSKDLANKNNSHLATHLDSKHAALLLKDIVDLHNSAERGSDYQLNIGTNAFCVQATICEQMRRQDPKELMNFALSLVATGGYKLPNGEMVTMSSIAFRPDEVRSAVFPDKRLLSGALLTALQEYGNGKASLAIESGMIVSKHHNESYAGTYAQQGAVTAAALLKQKISEVNLSKLSSDEAKEVLRKLGHFAGTDPKASFANVAMNWAQGPNSVHSVHSAAILGIQDRGKGKEPLLVLSGAWGDPKKGASFSASELPAGAEFGTDDKGNPVVYVPLSVVASNIRDLSVNEASKGAAGIGNTDILMSWSKTSKVPPVAVSSDNVLINQGIIGSVTRSPDEVGRVSYRPWNLTDPSKYLDEEGEPPSNVFASDQGSPQVPLKASSTKPPGAPNPPEQTYYYARDPKNRLTKPLPIS